MLCQHCPNGISESHISISCYEKIFHQALIGRGVFEYENNTGLKNI